MLNQHLERLQEISRSPRKVLDSYLSEGKKAAGCFPEYVPEPLIHAAGYIPFGLWGGETSIMRADSYMPNFACSIMRSCAEFGLSGAYKGLSFAVAPILCDALKGGVQTFRVAVKDFPMLPFALPQNRTLPTAGRFVAEEYRLLKSKIEALSGETITDEALWKSIAVYNGHRLAMQEFITAAAQHTDVITPVIRQAVFRSARFMEKGEHAAILRAVTEELRARPVCRANRIGVVLTGVTAGSEGLMRVLAEEGFDVLADHVYQDSWSYQAAIPEAPTPLEALAQHWLLQRGSCVTHEVKRGRADNITALVKEYKADAVILCLMKFCDPEEYEAPLLIASLKDLCPVLTLEIDQNSDNVEALRTRIQSFHEVIS